MNKFKAFNEENNKDNCLDEVIIKRLKDEEVRLEINKIIPGDYYISFSICDIL
ncbi:hypothetical protein [Alkaliphilus peptidifermentans]|uniref:Uncharacterized protein n=1 Tax=Alkaliphilus peptidifermentans DSM 18978 TaxID=1120976 RepID=A0A1G5E734_9FIRM|nr:hypothetical protein [Alkaliphilus peptidifermentans]SCY22833.1 hypothetical protein SAMN03080606_01072 [Alkaliphilus peptidifermentans DSM 18978]